MNLPIIQSQVLKQYFDSDDVEITEGSRLVWSDLLGEQSTGVVYSESSVFFVRVSAIKSIPLVDIVRFEAWCLVVPAYPKALLQRVA